MSIYSIRPITLGAVHTYPLASRKSKVSTRDFAKPPAANTSLTKVLDSLPNILAAEDLRHLLRAVHAARKQRKAILWGLGGHVIKVGLGPILIDLMKRGFISAIAMNGAALIHDFEIALAGNTSEDVEAGLGSGQFGMAEETGNYLNEFAKLSQRIRIGYGEAAGQFLNSGIIPSDMLLRPPGTRPAHLAAKMIWSWTNPDLSILALPRRCITSIIANPQPLNWYYNLQDPTTLPRIPGLAYTYLLPPDRQGTACPPS